MGSCNGASHPSKPYKERVRHFVPAWHTVNMGTGIIAILFHSFPYGGSTTPMQVIALFFLILNTLLFAFFTLCDIARYALFPSIWGLMIHHSAQSLFVGAFPMGGATLIAGAVAIVYEHFGVGGRTFLYVLWAFWWFDQILSFVVCFGQLHIMITRHSHSINVMTSAWLLPIVTLIVASSTGGALVEPLMAFNFDYALITLAVSFVSVVIGIMFALMILTIYVHRLIVFGLPEGIGIFSAFLPLGPLGQAAYSFTLIGANVKALFPLTGDNLLLANSMTPLIIDIICFGVAFMLWSLATAWVILAVIALAETLSKTKLPFKVTFWGMIFPNGVYANITLVLATIMDSSFFRIWGSIYAVFTLLLWLFATGMTIPRFWDGSAFEAPCLNTDENRLPTEMPAIRLEDKARTP